MFLPCLTPVIHYIIALHCIALHCIALHCIASHRIASPRLASPRLASPRLASPRLASPRLASPRLASPRLASPGIALHCIGFECRRRRGRPNNRWTGNVSDWTGKSFAETQAMAHNRQEWRELMRKSVMMCPYGTSRS